MRILLLIASLPVMLLCTFILIFNVLAALGNGKPFDLIYSIPPLAMMAVWSAYAAGKE